MPKGPYLTPKIKNLIKRIYIDNRQIGPAKAREQLLKRMKAEGLDEIFGPDFPSVSSVSKELKRLRGIDEERSDELKGLDEPWSPHSLPKYPIPPEALQLVMSTCLKCIVDVRFGLHSELWQLTVREALWIARLYKVVEFYHQKQMAECTDPSNTELEAELVRTGHLPQNYREIKVEDILLDWAYVMAGNEEFREIEGESLEPEEIGLHIVGNVFEYYGERRRDFVNELENWYEVDLHIFDPSSLSIADIEGILLKVLAKDREPHLDVVYMPRTEMSKLREVLDIDSAVQFNDMVFVPVKKDADVRHFSKLAGYKVDLGKLEEAGTAEALLVLLNKIIEKEKGGKK